jgi:hypothetical protein
MKVMEVESPEEIGIGIIVVIDIIGWVGVDVIRSRVIGISRVSIRTIIGRLGIGNG